MGIIEAVEINSQMITVETPLVWRHQGENADVGLILCLNFCPSQDRDEIGLYHLAISSELKHSFQKGDFLKKQNKNKNFTSLVKL